MKTKTDIQLELLQEFNEICIKNNLKYILYGANALKAYQSNTIKNASRYVSVAMTNGDIERFCQIIEKDYSQNRYVEGIFNNPFFVPFYVTYGNKNTTDFFVGTYDKNINHGIHIRLYPICKYAKKRRKKLTSWDDNLTKNKKYRESFLDPIERNSFWKRIVEARLYPLFGRNERYYKQFKIYNAIDRWEDIRKYDLVRIDKKIFFSKKLIQLEKYEVDGTLIFLPEDTDYFFKRLYGKNFRNKKIKKQNPTKREILDTESNYDEIYKKNADLIKEAQKLKQEIEISQINLKDEKQAISNLWKLVQMTDSQVRFRQIFTDEKTDELLDKDLNDKTQLNEVYRELRPIINKLNKYSEYDLTFSVNPRIDNLIMEVLLKKKNNQLADKIEILSQKEYLIE